MKKMLNAAIFMAAFSLYANNYINKIIIEVSPNPFKNFITVNSFGHEYDAILLDAKGNEIEIVYNDNSQINTSKLVSGIYFLKLNSGDFNKTFKLIKE